MTDPAADAVMEEVERIRQMTIDREVSLALIIDRLTSRYDRPPRAEKDLVPTPPEIDP